MPEDLLAVIKQQLAKILENQDKATDQQNRLDRDFGGISTLTNIPSVVVVVDPRHESMCIKEAKLLHIPVVALCNTDCTIEGIEYPVVGNDGSVPAVKFVLETIKNALAIEA